MSLYNNANTFECLPCAEGCDACKDASPCVAALNWPMRTSILVLACAVIGFLPPAAWFTFRYQHVKVSFVLQILYIYFIHFIVARSFKWEREWVQNFIQLIHKTYAINWQHMWGKRVEEGSIEWKGETITLLHIEKVNIAAFCRNPHD